MLITQCKAFIYLYESLSLGEPSLSGEPVEVKSLVSEFSKASLQ